MPRQAFVLSGSLASVYHNNGPVRSEGKDTDNLKHRKAQKCEFQLKKGLNIDFKVTRDGKNVHFT